MVRRGGDAAERRVVERRCRCDDDEKHRERQETLPHDFELTVADNEHAHVDEYRQHQDDIRILYGEDERGRAGKYHEPPRLVPVQKPVVGEEGKNCEERHRDVSPRHDSMVRQRRHDDEECGQHRHPFIVKQLVHEHVGQDGGQRKQEDIERPHPEQELEAAVQLRC